MPQVRSIESRIKSMEGFSVRILTENGADVRSDKVIPAQYDDYVNRASDTMTVASWKRVRFLPKFPGYSVEVQYRDGSTAHGGTQLATVRASYR
jgi:hypothetical protein